MHVRLRLERVELTAAQLQRYSRSLVRTLQAFKELDLVHRDVKTANIFNGLPLPLMCIVCLLDRCWPSGYRSVMGRASRDYSCAASEAEHLH